MRPCGKAFQSLEDYSKVDTPVPSHKLVNFRKKNDLLEHGLERATLEAVSVLEARRDDGVAPALGGHEHGLCLVRLRADLRARMKMCLVQPKISLKGFQSLKPVRLVKKPFFLLLF